MKDHSFLPHQGGRKHPQQEFFKQVDTLKILILSVAVLFSLDKVMSDAAHKANGIALFRDKE